MIPNGIPFVMNGTLNTNPNLPKKPKKRSSNTYSIPDISQLNPNSSIIHTQYAYEKQLAYTSNRLNKIRGYQLPEIQKKMKKLDSIEKEKRKQASSYKNFLYKQAEAEFERELKVLNEECIQQMLEFKTETILELEEMKRSVQIEKNTMELSPPCVENKEDDNQETEEKGELVIENSDYVEDSSFLCELLNISSNRKLRNREKLPPGAYTGEMISNAYPIGKEEEESESKEEKPTDPVRTLNKKNIGPTAVLRPSDGHILYCNGQHTVSEAMKCKSFLKIS